MGGRCEYRVEHGSWQSEGRGIAPKPLARFVRHPRLQAASTGWQSHCVSSALLAAERTLEDCNVAKIDVVIAIEDTDAA